jgi:tetratricopeptide (TPR) repeat protein
MVRAHRRRLGMSQEDVAGRSGLSVRGLRKIESGLIGRPRPATVRLLADVFGLAGPDRERFCNAALAAVGDAAGTTVPARLPADVAGFSGRAGHLRQLTDLLDAAGAPPAAPVVATISGTAGVGKTALAVHWAHRVAGEFPDGQLYVNLRGFHQGGQVMAPAEAVRGFLDALGVPPDRVPPDPAAQAALYRSLVAGRRMLVLLDNARDAAQVRPLLPATPTALAVVTSRDQLTGLVAADGAYPLALDVLAIGEAHELLARRLGPHPVAAEPDEVQRIVDACARLPLALAVTAARARQTGFPLATIAAELDGAGQRLDVLDAGDAASQVRAVFSWSYTALTPPAARLFRLLGLHPGPDISAAAAASLVGRPLREARRTLTELARANLLTERASGRYAMHDLLHAYAADLAERDEPADDRWAARSRLFDTYAGTAHAADRLLYPHREPIPLPPAPPAAGVHLESLADHDAAMAWLVAEHQALLAVARQAADTGFDAHAWQLAWAVDTFLDWRGHWRELAAVWQVAIGAARRLGDPGAQAYAHRYLALADTRHGRHADAQARLRHALGLYARTGDQLGQADTHRNAAYVCWRLGEPERALDHAQRALDLYRAVGHQRGQASALNAVGWYHTQLGDHASALVHCEQALDLLRRLGHRHPQAATWDSLGLIHHRLGHHAEAAACYRRALDLFGEVGDRYERGATLGRLGDTHAATGAHDAARDAWGRALEILTELDHPDAEAVRAKLADAATGPGAPDGGYVTSGRPPASGRNARSGG